MSSGPHPSSGGKEGSMHIKYKLEDGRVIYPEVSPELAEFILRNDREIANLERRERYHAPYHIEALVFEGEEFADHMTPEDIVIRKEELKEFYESLSFLTETQFRRLLMKAEHMSFRDIAEVEGVSVNAVMDSFLAIRRKMEKFKNYF